MLVLTRSLGEEIIIGDVIRVKVMSLRKGHVRLGIVAPLNVAVDREEIHRRRREFEEVPKQPAGYAAVTLAADAA